MIKNILFDMGGVLIHFDKEMFMDRLKISKEDRELLRREVFLSFEWAMMDRGTLTDLEAAEIMAERVPVRLRGAVQQLVGMWDRPIEPVDGMVQLVKELKERNYRILLLSNASCRHPDYWKRIPGHEYFDDRMISYEVKVVKPQPEIYLMAYAKFHIRPRETVFIDDLPMNVEAGIYTGMHGIVFHGDVAELRGKLKELGVEI